MKIRINTSRILTDVAEILQPTGGSPNSLGVSPAANLTSLDTGVACRLLPLEGANELKVGKKLSKLRATVFMMPWTNPADNTQGLNEHLWLKINGRYWDILQAVPPVIDGAPYEMTVETVNP